VVLAVPVAPPEAVRALAADADAIIALLQPADLKAVGLWYHDFSPVDDETVRQILIGAAPGTPATG
jgi:predicted phosphoribosyltransferase